MRLAVVVMIGDPGSDAVDQVVASEFGQGLGCEPAGAFPVTPDSQADDLELRAFPARPRARPRSPRIARQTLWPCWRSLRARRSSPSEAALARIMAWVVSPRVH